MVSCRITKLKKLAKLKGLNKHDSKRFIRNKTLKGLAIGSALGTAAGLSTNYTAKIAKSKYNNLVGKDKYLNNKNKEFTPPKVHAGDVVTVSRFGGKYKHYAIAVDNKGNVIEYNTKPGDPDPRNALIRRSTLKEMSHGDSSVLGIDKSVKSKYSPEETVKRAEAQLGSKNGKYNMINNNCEHFVNQVIGNGHKSKQVDDVKLKVANKLGNLLKLGTYSESSDLTMKLAKHNIIKNGYQIRHALPKELGGLSHFNKHQTQYLTAGGAITGSGISMAIALKKAKRDAIKSGLKPKTKEYKNFIKSRLVKSGLKGAAIGAGAGALSSVGLDIGRGKVIGDKLKYQHGVDLGKDYYHLGKGTRGIRSEKTVNNWIDNWKKVGGYGKAIIDMI
jgi:hypothetical protein